MHLIDCQSHIFSPEFAEMLAESEGPVRAEREDDSIIVRFGNTVSFRLKEADYAPEKKISDMDAAGVSVSVLSPNIPGPGDMDISLREPAARMCNDYTASVCSQYRDRFKGLAVLPFTTIESVMLEYARSMYVLGLSGIELLSNSGGRTVDDSCWDPLYAAAEADGIPMVLHPTVPAWGDAIRDYSMIPMVGFMVDHSFAMLRLILGGVLARHPKLKIIHPHCGGVLPYVMPRIDEQTEVKRRGRENISRAPSQYYKQVYLDIVSPSPQTARFAFEYMGADHLLFGSDHPWISIEEMVRVFNSIGLNEEQYEKVAYANAAALFSRPNSE